MQVNIYFYCYYYLILGYVPKSPVLLRKFIISWHFVYTFSPLIFLLIYSAHVNMLREMRFLREISINVIIIIGITPSGPRLSYSTFAESRSSLKNTFSLSVICSSADMTSRLPLQLILLAMSVVLCRIIINSRVVNG